MRCASQSITKVCNKNMATKKKSKNVAKTTSKRQSSKKKLSLTKEYMLALAKQVYDSKTKKFMPLCSGNLHKKEKNKKFLHCIVGKIHYDIIVNTRRGRATNDTSVAIRDLGDHVKGLFLKEFETIRNNITDIVNNGSIGIVDRHIEFSGGSMSCTTLAEDIADKLNDLVTTNDDTGPDGDEKCTISGLRERAKEVSRHIREIANYFPSEKFV